MAVIGQGILLWCGAKVVIINKGIDFGETLTYNRTMNQPMMTAQAFGRQAHDSIEQVRKYTGEPYWVHTESVANLVTSFGGTVEMVTAALFHDILEDVFPLDSYYNEELIRTLYGEKVASLVVELTDTFTKENYPNLGRKERKQGERERLAKASNEAKLIKLCDLIDNTKSIVEFDPKFARTYLQEKSALLPLLRNPYTEEAWQVADKQITSHQIQIVLNRG